MGASSDGGVLFTLVTALCIYSAGSCNVQLCSQQYSRVTEEEGVKRSPTYHYCSILHSYTNCIKATSLSCRGDLNYHSMKSLVVQWGKQNNCSAVLHQGPQPETAGGHRPGHRNQRPRPAVASECSSYRPVGGAPVIYSHCGLFGDPHLRTFYNELQTCGAMGAWPLIDNLHLAVQVTNSAVTKGFSATATTKITVIVRPHSPCAVEKTYEAQTDFLPAVFLDGSKSSGPGVRIREERPGEHIEIHLRYISTRIVIRQVGGYLTFAIKMPQEIAFQGAQMESLELCLRGCPRRERINFNQLLSHPDDLIPSATHNGGHMTKKDAEATCKGHNITGFYYDACVFDLLTTGDSTFSMAARHAMLDIMALSPSAVTSMEKNNGTGVPEGIVPRGIVVPENSAPGRTCSSGSAVWAVVMLCLLLLMGR